MIAKIQRLLREETIRERGDQTINLTTMIDEDIISDSEDELEIQDSDETNNKNEKEGDLDNLNRENI